MKGANFTAIGFVRELLLRRMKETGLDSIILTTPENVNYTTGYPCLPGSGNPILFALRNQFPFFSYIEQGNKITLGCWIGAILGDVTFECDNMEIWADRKGSEITMNNFFISKNLGGRKLGIESCMPAYMKDLIIKAAPDVRFECIDGLIQGFRLVKTDYEVQMLKKATLIAEKTIQDLVLEVIRPGITRPDLIQEAKWRMIRNGATGIGHTTISFGTSNPEVSIDETLGENQLVAIDIGASYYGYLSDIRRHVYTGEVPADMKAMHKKMISIVDEVGSSLVPDSTGREIYDLAVSIYEREGLIPLIVTAGHSIGLMTEEAWLNNSSDLVLKPDMVINVELYTNYAEGIEIGNEETFIITDTLPVKITSMPPEIICI